MNVRQFDPDFINTVCVMPKMCKQIESVLETSHHHFTG